jgi:hypothetical protein
MRPRLIKALASCAAALVLSESLSAAPADSKWIAQMKSTPMSEMEPGLSGRAFGDWFDEHTKNEEVHYRIAACDPLANTESLKKGTFSCVTVTAIRGAASEVVMRFLVAADPGNAASQKQSACRFIFGTEGPPVGSSIKRMTRFFWKLSAMTTILGGQSER